MDLYAASRFGAVFEPSDKAAFNGSSCPLYRLQAPLRRGTVQHLHGQHRGIASWAAQGPVGAENTLNRTLINALDTGFRVVVSELS